MTAMWDDWVSRMSGLFSVVFTAIALAFNLSNRVQAKYWAAAAVASYIVASFWVWYRHRPDLKIELRRVSVDSGVVEGFDRSTNYLTLQIYVVNRHPANNAIKRYELIIEGREKYRGEPVRTNLLTWHGNVDGMIDMDEFKDRVLHQAWPSEGWIRFRIQEAPFDEIKTRAFTLTVVDVYDADYSVKGTVPIKYTFDVVPIAHVAM
jgi:hypothetical protein